MGEMNVLLWTFIFCSFRNEISSVSAQIDYSNITGTINNEPVTDVNTVFNDTELLDNSTTPLQTETSPVEPNTTAPFGTRGATEPVTESVSYTSSVNLASVTTTTRTETTPSSSLWQPLPVSGSLPTPVKDVSSLCPCNLLESQCDVNCCCDADCNGDFALFTSCSVQSLIADEKMCSQDKARYSLVTLPDGSTRVESSFKPEVNPDVFCIQSANYEAGLSFANPEVPTEGSFDRLFRQFAGFTFTSASGAGTLGDGDPQTTPGYKYGDVIPTEGEMGLRGFFRLPAPAATASCSDANPAAFLKDQTTQCSRTLNLAQNCTSLAALSLQSFVNFQIVSVKNANSDLVGVDISTVTLRSLEGTLSLLDSVDVLRYRPVLLGAPGDDGPVVCNNVVFKVRYTVTYDEKGRIVSCAAAFVLGALNVSMGAFQQEFQIAFVQNAAGMPVSGNPGYVVGLPLVAGSKTADGIVQSVNRKEGLSLLQSSSKQDCLGEPAPRSPILFGVNMVSGCILRLEEASNCSLISELILGVLRGQGPAQYVASFGNSQPQNVMDWVPIKTQTTPMGTQGCSIPLSLDMEVTWTKYGSLVNPQAQIVNVTEVIKTNTSGLDSLSRGTGVVSISASVTFVDVSAAAQPGYKAPPTIDAKLPYDFFFPFV